MKRFLVVAGPQSADWAQRVRSRFPGREVLTSAPIDGLPVPYLIVDRAPKGLLSALEGLEMVLSVNAGVEHLLASGEIPPHVPIIRMADQGLVEGMMEWVMAQALAWHRNLFWYEARQRESTWSPQREVLARDRTVTVLGAGALGAPTAEMMRRIGFQTRLWSRTPRQMAGVEAFAGLQNLGAALEGADILVNLLPSTPQTDGLLNGRAFGLLGPSAFMINAGRGAAVIEQDLLEALDSGCLGGAALDVFRREPLEPDHPFWRHPKIRISPHVAAQTQPATAVEAICLSVRRHEAGEPLRAAVDRTAGY